MWIVHTYLIWCPLVSPFTGYLHFSNTKTLLKIHITVDACYDTIRNVCNGWTDQTTVCFFKSYFWKETYTSIRSENANKLHLFDIIECIHIWQVWIVNFFYFLIVLSSQCYVRSPSITTCILRSKKVNHLCILLNSKLLR